MQQNKKHNWAKTIIKGLTACIISMFVSISLSTMVLATEGKVIQPPIIPSGSTEGDGASKLYLPHDTSGETNQNYFEKQLLPGIATTIISITGGLALVFVIISGIQMLTAFGNGEAFTKARNTLVYAIVGLLIASLSYAIVTIIASINPQ